MLVDQSDPASLKHANHEDLIKEYGIEKLYESVPQRRSASDAPRPKASRRNDSFSYEPRKHQKTRGSSDGRHASREPIEKEKKGGNALSDGFRGASSSSATAAADVPGRAALRMTELASVAVSISSRGSTPRACGAGEPRRSPSARHRREESCPNAATTWRPSLDVRRSSGVADEDRRARPRRETPRPQSSRVQSFSVF